MLHSSEVLILGTVPYRDSGVIVHAYSLEAGRGSFALHIPRTSRTRLRSSLFTPMALLRAEWKDGRGTGLPHFTAAIPLHVYRDIPFSTVKTAVAMFLSEILTASLRIPTDDAPLFRFLESSLLWLDAAAKDDVANFHLVFLLHLSQYLGFCPDAESYSEGLCLDLRGGIFTSYSGADSLSPAESQCIEALMISDYSTARSIRLSRESRASLLRQIIRYYRLHIPAFPTLHSPAILSDIFS